MFPDRVMSYELDEVVIEKHELETNVIYWVQGGVGAIWFDAEQFENLNHLITIVRGEETERIIPTPLRVAAAMILVAILAVFVLVLV